MISRNIILSATVLLCFQSILPGIANAIKFNPSSITTQTNDKIANFRLRPLMLVNNISLSRMEGGDSITSTVPLYTKKNPWIAFGLALGPGCFVHGLGHYYAGHKKAAWVLLGTEILASAIVAWDYNRWHKTYPHGTDRVSLGFFAGLYIYTSWMYDVIWAPSKVLEDNKMRLQK
jgi:hypothetical protein